MDTPSLTTLTTVVQLVNAGGVVAVLIILVAGFWTGKIMSRKTHEEIAEKQTIIVDSFVDKINGSFEKQGEAIGVMFNDYVDFKDEWRSGLKDIATTLEKSNSEQTTILKSIETELKRSTGD